MEASAGALVSAAQPLAAIGLGWVLRRTHLFSTADGQTAAKFAVWVTLPSLILQSFNGASLSHIQLPVLAGALAVSALIGALSWFCYQKRHPKERGLLVGAAAGGASLALAAYPFIQSFFGAAGLRIALLCGLVNSLAVWVGSYLLFATAGAAFPEQYQHLDGGTYRGEWLGMLKQGYGVYTYPSGARYEGEWRNNVKEGRGVYRFPKGGVYEGEWRAGKMEGVGVRTFASGKVQAGFWRDGKLEASMEEWQCALAVEGANEAAAVARRVHVGGGGVPDALQQLLADPPTWAFVAAAALAVTGRQLTPTLDLVTSHLAVAHGPLSLVALGLTADVAPPQQRQVGEVSGVLALRLLPPLLLGAVACAAALKLHWPAVQTLGVLCPMLVCAVAPAAPQVLTYAYRYRLNENLAAAITRRSTAVALPLIPLLAVAGTVSAAAGSVLPFLVALGGIASLVALVTSADIVQSKQASQQKVFMRYAPSAAAAAAAAAAATASAGTAPASIAQPAAVQAAATAAPADGSGASAGSMPAAAAAAAEPAGQAGEPQPPADSQQQEPPPPRRRSAFSDVRPEQPPPAAALQSQQHSSSSWGAASQLGQQLPWQRQLRRLPLPRRAFLPRMYAGGSGVAVSTLARGPLY